MVVFIAMVPLVFRGSFDVDPDAGGRCDVAGGARGHPGSAHCSSSAAPFSSLVFTAFIGHSVLHIEPSIVALLGAGILILISRLEQRDYLASVEWETLLFFAGLFIMVGSLVKTGVVDELARSAIEFTDGNALAHGRC